MLFVFAATILRYFNQGLLALVLVWMALQTLATTGTEPVDLRPGAKNDSFRQMKAVIDVEGKLKLNPDGKEVTHLPLKVHADMEYAERVLAQTKQWSEARLARWYGSADAKIRLRESELESRLRDTRRLVVVESNHSDAVHFSPLGPLTREELDLIQTPASGIALEALLPLRAVKLGDQWPLADATVARLLGLEAVSQQKVACTLDSANDNVAIISIEGNVTGAVGGVSSDIELKGKLNFDLQKRAVTWLAMACKEDRAIGHAQPGFEIVTTVRLVSSPSQPVAELSDKALSGLSLKAEGGQNLLELTAESAGFQLAYRRQWQIMAQQHDVLVLRLVDRGDLIAQCNISPRPALAKGAQLTLEGFQDDVKRALGKNFEQLIEASEESNDAGIRILRVLVAGAANELPIQWLYYHLSDDHGHRAALVFTIESSLLERFAQVDRELVGGFRFLADKQPTPAAAKSASRTSPVGPVLR